MHPATRERHAGTYDMDLLRVYALHSLPTPHCTVADQSVSQMPFKITARKCAPTKPPRFHYPSDDDEDKAVGRKRRQDGNDDRQLDCRPTKRVSFGKASSLPDDDSVAHLKQTITDQQNQIDELQHLVASSGLLLSITSLASHNRMLGM